MEVVLQWLDEIDDAVFTLVFALVLRRHALRRSALAIGMASSLALAGCELTSVPAEWAPLLTAVAALSVAVWSVAAVATVIAGAGGPSPARA
ncbi:MAG: hypothetical protein JXB36_13940 [Gammaproteobacteria bacterium]|nr:hypothetical protein [Gammaproteobacteria bacterium]